MLSPDLYNITLLVVVFTESSTGSYLERVESNPDFHITWREIGTVSVFFPASFPNKILLRFCSFLQKLLAVSCFARPLGFREDCAECKLITLCVVVALQKVLFSEEPARIKQEDSHIQ
jgi:hypothetical protein